MNGIRVSRVGLERVVGGLVAGSLLLATGCSVIPEGDSVVPERSVVVADGAEVLPGWTTTDWVTYGDYLVKGTVTNEGRDEPREDQVERKEGTITRYVDLALSPEAVWSRPSRRGDLDKPATLEVANGGWVFHGNEEAELQITGQEKLVLGKEYLILLTYGDKLINEGGPKDGAAWFVLDAVPLEGTSVASASELAFTEPVREAIASKELAQVAGLLASTKIDPAAEGLMSEDPIRRYRDVDLAKNGVSKPGPGER